jgi:hypothetical protein
MWVQERYHLARRALIIYQSDGLIKTFQFFELIVLGFGSEDIGVALPLKRSMVVSKIHLTTKLTYQNSRHQSQWHCIQ